MEPMYNLDSDQILTLRDSDVSEGTIVFNKTDKKWQGWNGTEWINLNE